MRKPLQVFPFVWHLALVAALTAVVALAPQMAAAKSDVPASDGPQRYIVVLRDSPLVRYRGQKLSAPLAGGGASLEAVPRKAGAPLRVNLQSAEAKSYLNYLGDRQEAFDLEAGALLGRSLRPVREYRLATNGMAVDLTPAEAGILAESGLVKAIHRNFKHFPETYAGPRWIGAAELWDGLAGFPETRGEGIVVGVIDSGINWESPSFADPWLGYSYTNPRGHNYGLCDDPEVQCNNKLIGVYDFVEDDPSTETVEENTKGRDIDPFSHGSHVSSTAVGNPVNIPLSDDISATLSGVAPRANLMMYRVCDPETCLGDAILQAIEQAIEDEVDVINYSLGSLDGPSDPWSDPVSLAFGAARDAGIFVATSAGNEGPAPGTIGSPANAPWIVAVGAATHDQIFGNQLRNMVGGDTPPPDDMIGYSLTGGTGQLLIVHAGDFGSPLCGTGEPESGETCDDNTGASSPWAGETPFHGEIVVCDRGTYGRVEKGKNLLLAGAGGYILANTDESPQFLAADEHCLPATHIDREDGDRLRTWLASGSGHGGQITAAGLVSDPGIADVVAAFSSRGPMTVPGEEWVANALKPNVIAPGVEIIAAYKDGQIYGPNSGTSMASPHVAGAAALLKSVHPDWSVSQLASAIETTATGELATNEGHGVATPHDRGSGRPQLGEAANAGLYLDVTGQQFLLADPQSGGDPGDLNLAGLVDASCKDLCTFFRTVTDQMGGGDWTATAEDFPGGVDVSITPQNFSLTNGASQTLQIDIDVADVVVVGEWISGRVRLSADGSADQYLTVSVAASDLTIEDDRNGGWQTFTLAAPMALPDATYQVGGLTKPERTSEVLPEDPDGDPYDGDEGVFTRWHALPQGGLWLHAKTLASTAEDLDLFVGRDENGNGAADAFEELCASTSPDEFEQCDLFDLEPGDYWVLVQNWTAGPTGEDEATLLSAAIAPGAGNNLAASGPGIVGAAEALDLRLSWDNLSALPGEEWIGAVGIGSHRESPNDAEIYPVYFRRTGIAAPATFPLQAGGTHRMALPAGGTHDRMFIDVPTGSSSLTVTAAADDSEQNDSLSLELRRLDFGDALQPPPFAASPGGAPVIASDTGDGGEGPAVTVSGASLQPGRWYAVLINGDGTAVAVEVAADIASSGSPQPIHRGLWEPSSRPGLGQGYEYNWGGSNRALIWYTYDEDGQPAWYIAGAPEAPGNIWTSVLYRVTNDGERQQLAQVGYVSVTTLAEDDALFSYTLFGESGTERMQPLSPLTCPQVDGAAFSGTGLWYRGVDGLGGASVVMNALTQAHIHYLFDALGIPRWLVAQDPGEPDPTNPELPMLQFNGYCAVCSAAPVSYQTVGLLERAFSDDNTGSWTLDYVMEPPLSGSVQRTDDIIKLTSTLECQ